MHRGVELITGLKLPAVAARFRICKGQLRIKCWLILMRSYPHYASVLAHKSNRRNTPSSFIFNENTVCTAGSQCRVFWEHNDCRISWHCTKSHMQIWIQRSRGFTAVVLTFSVFRDSTRRLSASHRPSTWTVCVSFPLRRTPWVLMTQCCCQSKCLNWNIIFDT